MLGEIKEWFGEKKKKTRKSKTAMKRLDKFLSEVEDLGVEITRIDSMGLLNEKPGDQEENAIFLSPVKIEKFFSIKSNKPVFRIKQSINYGGEEKDLLNEKIDGFEVKKTYPIVSFGENKEILKLVTSSKEIMESGYIDNIEDVDVDQIFARFVSGHSDKDYIYLHLRNVLYYHWYLNAMTGGKKNVFKIGDIPCIKAKVVNFDLSELNSGYGIVHIDAIHAETKKKLNLKVKYITFIGLNYK